MPRHAPTALLFPGQGSQTSDMRETVERATPELLEQAIASLGSDPFERIEEGTAFVQPALYCASLAGWAAAGRPTAAFMAGPSLGGGAALPAAGGMLEAAIPRLKEAGLRTMRLRVQGSFPSPAIAPAVPAFRAALAEVEVSAPRVPVISGTTALPFDDVRRRLAEALVSPVRWRETLLRLHELGARRYVETGPGSVLTGLVRRTLDGVEATVLSPEPVHA